MYKFWMVYGFGQSAPTFKHQTPQLALAEAKRLCLKEGGRFVVLEAMALIEPAEPKVSNLRKPASG